jgi:hypothetical protein
MLRCCGASRADERDSPVQRGRRSPIGPLWARSAETAPPSSLAVPLGPFADGVLAAPRCRNKAFLPLPAAIRRAQTRHPSTTVRASPESCRRLVGASCGGRLVLREVHDRARESSREPDRRPALHGRPLKRRASLLQGRELTERDTIFRGTPIFRHPIGRGEKAFRGNDGSARARSCHKPGAPPVGRGSGGRPDPPTDLTQYQVGTTQHAAHLHGSLVGSTPRQRVRPAVATPIRSFPRLPRNRGE